MQREIMAATARKPGAAGPIAACLVMVWCCQSAVFMTRPVCAQDPTADSRAAVTLFQEMQLPGLVLEQLQWEWEQAPDPAEKAVRAQRLQSWYCRQWLEGQPDPATPVWDPILMDRIGADAGNPDSPLWMMVLLSARLRAIGLELELAESSPQLAGRRAEVLRDLELTARAVEWSNQRLAEQDQAGWTLGDADFDVSAVRFRGWMVAAATAVQLAEHQPDQVHHLEKAERLLCQLLQLGDVSLVANQLETWTPVHAWQWPYLEDLAFCLIRRGNTKGVDAAIAAIERGFGNAGARRSRLRVLARAGDWAAVEALARQSVGAAASPEEALACWWNVFVLADRIPAEQAVVRQNLEWLALAAFARLDPSRIGSLLGRERESRLSDAPNRFLASWIAGLRVSPGTRDGDVDQLQLARLPDWLQPGLVAGRSGAESPDGAILTVRRDLLRSALESPDPRDPLDEAACRRELAATLLELEEWEAAAGEAGAAADLFRKSDQGAATEQAVSIQLNALRQIEDPESTEPDRLRELALAAAREFAGRPLGEAANREIRILELRQRPPAEALAFWQSWLDEHPDDPTALAEMLGQLLRLQQSTEEGEQRQQLWRRTLDTGIAMLEHPQSGARSRIRVCSALLHAAGDDQAAIPPDSLQRLQNAMQALKEQPGFANLPNDTQPDPQKTPEPDQPESARGPALRSEWLWNLYRLAALAGDSVRQTEALQQLLNLRDGSPWYRQSLLVRARQLDEAFDRDSGFQFASGEELEQAIRVYADLVNWWGKSAEVLQRDPNARLAVSRLARLRGQQGDAAGGLELWEAVLAAFPADRAAVWAAAGLAERAGRQEQAAGLWRQAARLSEPGTDAWRESRLGWIRCLQRMGSETSAEEVRQQSLEFDPEMPEPWQKRFQEKIPAASEGWSPDGKP